MPNQVEKKAPSLEKAHIDGATVTCQAMCGWMNVAKDSAENLYYKQSFRFLKTLHKVLFESKNVHLALLFVWGSPSFKAYEKPNFVTAS